MQSRLKYEVSRDLHINTIPASLSVRSSVTGIPQSQGKHQSLLLNENKDLLFTIIGRFWIKSFRLIAAIKCISHVFTHLERFLLGLIAHQEHKGCTARRKSVPSSMGQICNPGWLQVLLSSSCGITQAHTPLPRPRLTWLPDSDRRRCCCASSCLGVLVGLWSRLLASPTLAFTIPARCERTYGAINAWPAHPQGLESYSCWWEERQNCLSPLLCLPVLKTQYGYEVASVYWDAGWRGINAAGFGRTKKTGVLLWSMVIDLMPISKKKSFKTLELHIITWLFILALY